MLLLILIFSLTLTLDRAPLPADACPGLAVALETHLENSLRECVDRVGLGAGWANPDWTIEALDLRLASGYLSGTFLPDVDRVTNDLARCVEGTLKRCTDEQGLLESVGCTISPVEFEVDVVLTAEDVVATAHVTFDQSNVDELAVGSTHVPLRLRETVDRLGAYLDAKSAQVDARDFDMDALSGSGANTSLFELRDGTIIHAGLDTRGALRDDPYLFLMAESYR